MLSTLLRKGICAGVIMTALGWTSGWAQTPAAPKSLVETLAGTPEFSTLTKLLTQTGLAESLKGAGPFTVFAPTDAAFAAVPKKTLDALMANPDKLKQVLLYHVATGQMNASQVMRAKDLETMATGKKLKVNAPRLSSITKVGQGIITTVDVSCTNGVVHVVDSVLIP